MIDAILAFLLAGFVLFAIIVVVAFTARLMDAAIPLPIVGGIGVDSVIGFVPYVGDAVSALVTGSLIYRSLQYGVPNALVARMVGNMFLDLLIGAVPVVGDLFDIVFKANTRNITLLRNYLEHEKGAPRGDATPIPGTRRAPANDRR